MKENKTCVDQCSKGFFKDYFEAVCTPCHECPGCVEAIMSGSCVDLCRADFYEDYANQSISLKCSPCHEECNGCTGPSAAECKSCKNFQILDDPLSHKIKTTSCTNICPEDFPYEHHPSPPLMPFCSERSWLSKDVSDFHRSIVLSIPSALVLLVIVGIIICLKNKENIFKKLKIVATKKASENDDIGLNNLD